MIAVCFVCGVERSCLPLGPFDEPVCDDCRRENMVELAKGLEQLKRRKPPGLPRR